MSTLSATRTTTTASSPEIVFDLLRQMGYGRAGWYSYDWIDNLGRRSADHLDPEWYVHGTDDHMPGGPIDFDVVEFDRPHRIAIAVKRTTGPWSVDFTLSWALLLLSGPRAETQISSTARIEVSGPGGSLLTSGLLWGDGVMVRRQLRGLADRAAALHAEITRR